MSGNRPMFFRLLTGGTLLALSLSLLVLPLLPVSSSTSNTNIVASDAEQTVGISANSSPSLSTSGGQNLFEDSFGKFLAVYVDWDEKLSVTYSNSNPSSSGVWAASVKSPGTTAFAYPAGVLVNSTSLRIIVENTTGSGLGFPGSIVDVPVAIQRGSGNNIVGVSFGATRILDGSGLAQFPSATLAHNGDVLAAWNWLSTSSRIKTFRWNHTSGSWTSLTGSGSSPDDVIIDSLGRGAIYPIIFERPDNFNVYVVGNYDNSGPSNMVFNEATFSGSAWSWGTQNLSYETTMAHGLEDSTSVAWDPLKSLVVVACRMTSASSFDVFTLNASDVKSHLNTPSFPTTPNYGSISVNVTDGDYYLFLTSVSADGGTGSLAYTRAPTGSANWNATLTVIDSASTNRGVGVRRTGSDKTLDLLYENDGTVPATIKIARVSAGVIPQALAVDFTTAPSVPSPDKLATLTGTTSGGTPPYRFSWSFGDGSRASGQVVYHAYDNEGMYTAQLNVTDSAGVMASRQHGLVVSSAVISFAAFGDFDFTPETVANWQALSFSGVNFTLAVGDFLYSVPTTQAAQQSWCSNFKASAPGGNVEILVGNHETWEDNATSGGGSINKYVIYCPFTLGAFTGTYGFQYYFDYPSYAPLARFLMLDPSIWMGNTTQTRVLYGDGSPAQQWAAAAIDSARAEGIPWIIAGMHKNCISTGVEGCEIGPEFMNFLINKRVDIVIQGHDHDYQRSKQLACATAEVYQPSCVASDGSAGAYQKGAGTVFLIEGTGGATLDHINATDGDYGYFARTNSTTWGYTKIIVSGSTLEAVFIPTTGVFTDNWSIITNYTPTWIASAGGVLMKPR